MDFDIIIPTFKREDSLQECIKSVIRQTRTPKSIIVIDDAEIASDRKSALQSAIQDAEIQFIYHKKDHNKEPKGTSSSRNIGMNIAQSPIVFVLDDDIVLEYGFCKEIMRHWEEKQTENNIVAVGGIIKNNRKKGCVENIFETIFGLKSSFAWDINSAGYQTWNDAITEAQKGHYAHGGLCSYNKSIAQELGGFHIFNNGRDALEDVEFFLKAKNNGLYTVIIPSAKATHNHHPSGRTSLYKTGWQESQNRKYIRKTHCKKSTQVIALFILNTKGWIMKQILALHLQRSIGMIVGMISPYKKTSSYTPTISPHI